jgi:hypothetical protein
LLYIRQRGKCGGLHAHRPSEPDVPLYQLSSSRANGSTILDERAHGNRACEEH